MPSQNNLLRYHGNHADLRVEIVSIASLLKLETVLSFFGKYPLENEYCTDISAFGKHFRHHIPRGWLCACADKRRRHRRQTQFIFSVRRNLQLPDTATEGSGGRKRAASVEGGGERVVMGGWGHRGVQQRSTLCDLNMDDFQIIKTEFTAICGVGI